MKIIISPAKKMNIDTESGISPTTPVFVKKAEALHGILSKMSYDELKSLWMCSDSIAAPCAETLKKGFRPSPLTPAIFAYDGIQYKYMAPAVFSDRELEYIGEHLVILSGFYGALRAFDGVTPYRLEMQAKPVGDFKSLYDFWGSDIYGAVHEDGETIVDLASKEYSRAVLPYCQKGEYITCLFCEEKGGNLREKGTLCKMARGSMVRFMAENGIKSPEGIKNFTGLGFSFSEELSGEEKYVFVKKADK